ncbi:DUF3570 domain-containing protein [Bacteroidota bacterium]
MLHRLIRKVFIVFVFVIFTGNMFAQNIITESGSYKKRKLSKVETEFLFGYYQQDGDHSAVTGGIGTEELKVYAPAIIVIVPFIKDSLLKTLKVDFGIDAYTSASSDQIDPATISSASSKDGRGHISINLARNNLITGNTWAYSVSGSMESDYNSIGIGMAYTKLSKDENREFGINGNAYFDTWIVNIPIELRPPTIKSKDDYPRKDRNSFSLSLDYSQVINKRMQMKITSDIVYQTGLLSTPFHRVYFSDSYRVRTEELPDTRFKLPLGIRFNYFINSYVIARTYYRYYFDNWNISAHTFNIELPVKMNSFFSIYPFYRYYTQTKSSYFKPYMKHLSNAPYYTSDYDLSDFESQLIGLGFRYAPIDGVLRYKNPLMGKRKITSMEIRYGHYTQTTKLIADEISMYLNFRSN